MTTRSHSDYAFDDRNNEHAYEPILRMSYHI